MPGRGHHQPRRDCLNPPGERADGPHWRPPRRTRRLVLPILILLLHAGFFLVLKNGLLQRNVPQMSPNIVTATIFPPDVTVIAPSPTALPPAMPPLPPVQKPLPPKPKQPGNRPAALPRPAPIPPSMPKPAPSAVAAPSSRLSGGRPEPFEASPALTDPAAPAVSVRTYTPATASAPAPAPATRPAGPKTITSGVRYLEAPQPEYPAQSKRSGEQGRVVLRVRIDENGRSGRIAIEVSSGFVHLDDAAIDAVRHALFQPHAEDGRQIAVDVIVPITFRLDR